MLKKRYCILRIATPSSDDCSWSLHHHSLHWSSQHHIFIDLEVATFP